MADMLKIAGKTSSDIAKPFLVEDDGRLDVSRPWSTFITDIVYAEEIRDTTVRTIKDSNVIDISKYPINSLRIISTLDADLELYFYYDLNKASTTYIDDFTSGTLRIVIPADDNHIKLITPNDLPLLEYGKYLKFRYAATSEPTTGYVSITHVGKG